MYKNHGEIDIEHANEMNVPVAIFISKLDREWSDQLAPAWANFKLTADNFMPRKGFSTESAYKAYADTEQELQDLVRKYVQPLYEAALWNVQNISTTVSQYYWEKEDGNQ